MSNENRVTTGVKRFDKSLQAASSPTALGLIRRKYENAIEFTARPPGSAGLILFFAIICPLIGLGGAYSFASFELEKSRHG
jgi:hypothetical protein